MKALDTPIQQVHEAYWNNEQQAARGKAVLLVEGDDDREVIEEILRQRRSTWATKVRIIACGGREHVLQRMKTFHPALGLVDRDTWTQTEVEEARREQPQLYITTGWCLENLFLSPAWLQSYDERVGDALSSKREEWVRAGALWWTLQRAREAQQQWQTEIGWSYGSPPKKLDLSSKKALAESLSAVISEQVRRESSFEPEAVAETFEKRCKEMLQLPEAEQWSTGVHGKRAFNELLLQQIQTVCGQTPSRIELASQIGRPAPLDELLAQLLP